MKNIMEINEPFKSNRTNKKYSVYVVDQDTKKVKLIHFGDRRYKHYHDKIGSYVHLDHKDPERRRRYRARASNILDKRGRKTYRLKWKPNYWAYNYLW